MASVKSRQRKQKISKETWAQKVAVNTQGYERGLSQRTKRTKEHIHEKRHNDLMEKVVQKANMEKALRRVEQNKGAPGVDGITVENFRPYLKEHWAGIKDKLLNGTYKPLPVRRLEIPKPDGGERPLGIPTVMDRLIQQAVLQILTPIFDPLFSPYSFGFRPNRSAHQAVKRAQYYIQQGYRHVVDTDLEKFFDRVNHDILMSKLARKIEDKSVLKLVRRYLRAGVMIGGCLIASEEGTPQGGPLSPLLANIMLHELDVELMERGHRFVRYADDCNIYVKSARAGKRVLESVTKFVEQQLKLKVNKEKSASDRPWNRKILGFTFSRTKAVEIWLAPKSRVRFKATIKELTRRSRSQSMAKRLEKLNHYLKGWLGYFHKAQMRKMLLETDEWIRRRLRACMLKQWKRSATKHRKLVGLGIAEAWAHNISGSRKGCWRLSHSHQMHKALGLTFWQEQGLVGLVERYDALRVL